MRRVILHYHLFKNAGTSLDDAFKEAFGERWLNVEADAGVLVPDHFRAFIENHPDHQVFSSHTAVFPVPSPAGCTVFPLVFVRHPIDRARSVYHFERNQKAETDGAIAAKKMDFAQYVAWRLDRPGDHQFRNFNVVRCSAAPPHRANLSTALELLSTLSFVGLVEAYDRSIAELNGALGPIFRGVKLAVHHSNQTQSHAEGLEERVALVKQELGPELFARLLAANADDLALFEILQQHYARLDEGLDASGHKPESFLRAAQHRSSVTRAERA